MGATVGAKQQLLHIQSVAGFLMLGFYIRFAITTRRLYQNETSVWRPVGEDKRRSFMEYRRLYCECDMVFFGDNGQGDLLCAEELMQEIENEMTDDLDSGDVFAFIHEVIPRKNQLQISDCKDDEAWEEKDIHFFRTYIGAALQAYKVKLITEEGLARVARSAVEDLVRLGTAHAWDNKKKKKRMDLELTIQEMNADVEEVNKCLPEGMPRVGKVPEALLTLSRDAGHEGGMTMGKTQSMKAFKFSTTSPERDLGGH